VKSCGPAAVRCKISSSLQVWVKKHLPADYSAGCIFTPVEGLSSESWRIVAGNHHCLARHESAEKRLLGISRKRECRLLRSLTPQAIAPSIICWQSPWLAVSWINGQTLNTASFFSQSAQKRLATMLAALHGSTPQGEPLDLKRRLQIYWQSVDPQRLSPAWLRVHQRLMKRRLPSPVKMSTAHMDIHPENWVEGAQGDRLIDWEYAANADIALEFAALFCANGYSVQQQTQLLRYYAQSGGYSDILKLERQVRRWQPWLEYLMLMWFEVRWQQTADVRYIDWAQPLRQKLFNEL